MLARVRNTLVALGLLVLSVWMQTASALPAYARQTGQNCVACHVSFPELTPYGRLFKLTGYTIGTRQDVPLAAMIQVGVASTANNRDANGNQINPKNDEIAPSQGSIFLAGKATDNIGAFAQWTFEYQNIDPNSGNVYWHSGSDNTDIRAVGMSADPTETDLKWIYGFTLHNNPTVQDVWNSTPAFGFPFTQPPNVPSPTAATQIEGAWAQQVAGLGGYLFYDKTWYGEATLYRTADGVFSFFRAGNWGGLGSGPSLDGYNPYLRFAYNHEWGPNSIMVGMFGWHIDVFPNDLIHNGPTDKYTDLALDSQYQYITGEHTFTMQGSLIHESQNLNASFPSGGSANPTNTLWSDKIKATYYYEHQYGATLALFDIYGSKDAVLYAPGTVGGSSNGSPSSTGYIVELNYLPIQNVRLMLQYTGYTKFNGGNTNYDGFGRTAKQNNTVFLNLWVAL
ncbi:MAG: cytochrome C [Burkholderiaceae bacterium]